VISEKNNDACVQQFLDDTAALAPDKFVILTALRAIVRAQFPAVTERMMYGGIMFSHDDADFGGVFVSKHHVSFEFVDGYLLADQHKLLEGKGKFRRHLKIKSVGDVTAKDVVGFVGQICRFY